MTRPGEPQQPVRFGHGFDAVYRYSVDGAASDNVTAHGRRARRAGDNRIDWLGIAAVERILGEAGIDMADLVEVTDDSPPPAGHGAA